MSSSASILDPIFGETTVGPYGYGFTNLICGSWFTCPEAGIAESLTAYIENYWGAIVKCAIYKRADNSLVGVTEERSLVGGKRWETFNFPTPKPSLENIDYWLVAWTSSTGTYINYDYETAKGGEQSLAYDAFPDPWSPSSSDRRFSIYCTYSIPVAPGVKAMYGGLYLVSPF